jgi:hypothetical protein
MMPQKASIDELIPPHAGTAAPGGKHPIPPRDVRAHDTDIVARVTIQRLGDYTPGWTRRFRSHRFEPPNRAHLPS